ncbi:serine hydrolase domain-containing protein [Altererythrobacter sp. GH1-8]|uniref:serine hydrolase domain-containing protein n=1 Tax=Altererythrobacter sp. GH1-8 TaxID=3349333 RepID=UPI00374D9A40
MKRFNSLADGASGGVGLGGYDTLEPLKGADQPAPIPVEAAASLSPTALETARSYVDGRNTSAFIVWRNGVIEQEAYYGDVGQDTPLVSRSLAKPISAIIIGRAISEGFIKSLDQPVADFITEWRGDELRERILIRHLLDMRSGFLPQALADKPEDILNRAYLHPRHDEIIINEMPVVDEPGSRYEYANATSEMVAPVIERATGKRYGEYLTEALLQPLGAKGGSIWVNQIGGTAHSGCCALLPARTYLKLGVLLLQDGVWDGKRLLPEGYVSAMRTGTEQNPYYGLGVWLPHSYVERRGYAHPSVPYGKVFHSEPYADKDVFLFDGNGNQVVYMVPSANMVILRVGGRAPKDVAEWDNTFLPNLLIKDAFRENPAALPEPQPM